MSFFQDETVQDIVQTNIERLSTMEEKQAQKLLKSLREVRTELMSRLATIPEGTFSEQQLNVTLVQVQTAIDAINRKLKDEMFDAGTLFAERGVNDLVTEINRMNKKFSGSIIPLNLDAIMLATDTQNFLVNKYDASIDAYSADLRAQITGQLLNSLIARDTTQRTVSQLVGSVGKFFAGEEWKLTRIARTEFHGAYNYSKINGMIEVRDETLPDLMKTLMHPMDKRTGEDSKALAQENPIIPIDEPFVQNYNGKKFIFMAPPNRPNDRAVLLPYRKVWGNVPRAIEYRKNDSGSKASI